jgi:DHA1 family tetracycline resistance protein-like MFS transporter
MPFRLSFWPKQPPQQLVKPLSAQSVSAAPSSPTDSATGSANPAALTTLFAIVFIDILGYTLVLPLLPFYAESLGASPFQVGTIVAVFGFCQLISGPILGKLSDRFGRKPILMFSQIGTCLGFILLAQAGSLFFVFLARILDGVTAGNIVVAQAYVADTTTPKQRTKAMGTIGAAFGLGFILGPAITGLLASFSHSAPIWVAAGLSFITILCSQFFLKETVIKSKDAVPLPNARARDILKSNHPLVVCLSAYLLFCVSFGIFTSGLALFAERVLDWRGRAVGVREVGYALAISGFATLITQLFLVGRAVNAIGEYRMACRGFIGMAIGILLCGLTVYVTPAAPLFLTGMIIHAVSAGFIRPSLNGLMSQTTSPRTQGLVFGLAQTTLSLSNIFAPLIAGATIDGGHYSAWSYIAVGFAVGGGTIVLLSKSIPRNF